MPAPVPVSFEEVFANLSGRGKVEWEWAKERVINAKLTKQVEELSMALIAAQSGVSTTPVTSQPTIAPDGSGDGGTSQPA